MKVVPRLFTLAALTGSVFAGCNCDTAVGALTFVCSTTDECGDGYSCIAGLCQPGDAGTVIIDAGSDDAGHDAGSTDSGQPDAGPFDAGSVDAGVPDAGQDAGQDAGLGRCGAPAVVPVDAGVVGVYCALERTMVIDANLSDWAGVPFTPLNARNAARVKGSQPYTGNPAVDDADLSGSFALQWDDRFLYIAGRLTDDARAFHPSSNDYFRDDCFQPYIDGNRDRSLVPNPADDLAVLIRADNAGQEFVRATNTVLPFDAGGKLSATRDNPEAGDGGWNVEVAIPWSRLGGSAVVRGRIIGFDLIIDDSDNTVMQSREHFLIWAQRVDGGSGCDEPFCSTVGYGDAVLTGVAP